MSWRLLTGSRLDTPAAGNLGRVETFARRWTNCNGIIQPVSESQHVRNNEWKCIAAQDRPAQSQPDLFSRDYLLPEPGAEASAVNTTPTLSPQNDSLTPRHPVLQADDVPPA